MPKLLTQPDLDAALVERTAKAIGRARILADYPPPEPMISEDGYALYWERESPEYRARFRRQAIAALRASALLERVAELERAIERANTYLGAYAHDANGNAWARREATAHLRKVHDKKIV